jgi:hypothetical protein
VGAELGHPDLLGRVTIPGSAKRPCPFFKAQLRLSPEPSPPSPRT